MRISYSFILLATFMFISSANATTTVLINTNDDVGGLLSSEAQTDSNSMIVGYASQRDLLSTISSRYNDDVIQCIKLTYNLYKPRYVIVTGLELMPFFITFVADYLLYIKYLKPNEIQSNLDVATGGVQLLNERTRIQLRSEIDKMQHRLIEIGKLGECSSTMKILFLVEDDNEI